MLEFYCIGIVKISKINCCLFQDEISLYSFNSFTDVQIKTFLQMFSVHHIDVYLIKRCLSLLGQFDLWATYKTRVLKGQQSQDK